MSLVTQQITVTVSITDASDSASIVRVRLPAATSVGAAQSAAESLIAVLLPLTEGKIARYSVSYQKRNDSTIIPLSVLPTPLRALFTFETTPDPLQFSTIVIPLDETWLETTGPLAGFAVDLTNSEVIEFTDEITDGPWVDQFGVDIGDVSSAFRTEAE
jgi:hypothetical protein